MVDLFPFFSDYLQGYIYFFLAILIMIHRKLNDMI